MDFAARYILDELGIELEEPEADHLDTLIRKFGLKFPTTREFSALAGGSIPKSSIIDAPDETLLAWIEREEQLFGALNDISSTRACARALWLQKVQMLTVSSAFR